MLLDEVMREPESPCMDHLLTLEVKSLRDTRDLLEKVSIKDAAAFIDENPHPRLWQVIQFDLGIGNYILHMILRILEFIIIERN